MTFVVAMLAMGVGAAAPAVAGENSGRMVNWENSQRSPSWQDSGKGPAKTKITFGKSCTREFNATIRRAIPRKPDPQVGKEHIDCRSYTDAVVGKHAGKGNHHVDVSGLGYVCYSGACRTYGTRGTYKAVW